MEREIISLEDLRNRYKRCKHLKRGIFFKDGERFDYCCSAEGCCVHKHWINERGDCIYYLSGECHREEEM